MFMVKYNDLRRMSQERTEEELYDTKADGESWVAAVHGVRP
jgi:hypothetical protein